MEKFNKLIELVDIKNKIDIKRGDSKYMNIEWMLNQIVEEVNEVKNEVKENNHIYLDDELADILWAWLMLVEKTHFKGLSSDINTIVDKAFSKYSQRVLPLKGTQEDKTIWKNIKSIQKRRLEEEHRSRKCKE